MYQFDGKDKESGLSSVTYNFVLGYNTSAQLARLNLINLLIEKYGLPEGINENNRREILTKKKFLWKTERTQVYLMKFSDLGISTTPIINMLILSYTDRELAEKELAESKKKRAEEEAVLTKDNF